MRVFEIDRDMDHAGAFALRQTFDDLADSAVDVCLDLSRVLFLDSAGLGEMDGLCTALRRRALRVSVIHAQGQPLRLLRQSLWGSACAASTPRPS